MLTAIPLPTSNNAVLDSCHWHKPMNRQRTGATLDEGEEVAMTGGRHNEELN
jgi:hypothetical protein